MPAGPDRVAVTVLPDFAEYRRRLLADCERHGAPVPDDRTIASQYEHTAVVLARAKAKDDFHAWEARQRLEAVKGL